MVDSRGTVEMEDTGWPLMKVSVDQVKKATNKTSEMMEGADTESAGVKAALRYLDPAYGGSRYGGLYGVDGISTVDRHGEQKVGTVDPTGAPTLIDPTYGARTGTRAGKDLPLSHNYLRRRGLLEKEAKIVFEVRRFTNPLNQLQDRLAGTGGGWTAGTDDPVYEKLESVGSTPAPKSVPEYTGTDFHWNRLRCLDEIKSTPSPRYARGMFLRQSSAVEHHLMIAPFAGIGVVNVAWRNDLGLDTWDMAAATSLKVPIINQSILPSGRPLRSSSSPG